MAYIKWKIEVTPYAFENWDDADTYELINARDILVKVNIGEAKDNFSFNSTNFNGQNNNKLNPNDRVIISRVVNSDIIDSTNLLMTGTVQDSPDELSYNKDNTKVEGYNYSEQVAKAIVYVPGSVNLVLPQALELALSNAGRPPDATGTSKFSIKWSASNPTVKSDGSPFPNPSEAWNNWTLKKILEQYSKPDYTGDGAYVWYVSKDNELIWRRREIYGNSSSFNFTTDEVLDIKTKKDLKDIKNFLIVKGGRDPAGRGVQDKVIDYASVAKNGRKFYIYTLSTNSADDLIAKDVGTDATTRYPPSYTDFVTGWEYYTPAGSEVVKGVTCISGQKVTGITTDVQYNAIVRQHVLNTIQVLGNSYLDEVKYGKFKTDLTFRAGKKNWALGDRITCTIPQAFPGTKVLRVSEIQYSTTTDVFSLEEDTGTIGSN